MIYWITCSFMAQRVMDQSREALENTLHLADLQAIKRTIFVDHRYPLGENGPYLKEWARMMGADLICPPKNLGGHGGVTYALQFLSAFETLNDNDIVFIIDPDSYPLTDGWFGACVASLENDNTLGGISVMDERLVERPWQVVEVPFSPKVGFLPAAEMWNMSAFRYKTLRAGFLADSAFYGYVETAMWKKMHSLGLRHGYLIDFIEGANPAPHDALYVAWKEAHARGGDKRNFDQFLEEKLATPSQL